MIRRPPRSTPLYSSAASDVYKRQPQGYPAAAPLVTGNCDAEEPGRVVPADRPQPLVPQPHPGEYVELVGVGIRDVREVGAEQDPVAEVGQPRHQVARIRP